MEYFTKKDVEENSSIGWFIEGNQVKQVISFKPYKIRVVGYYKETNHE